ncbi:acyltransferase [Candidatus Nitrospira allomarina]|jgi:acetyltransferase-like isoleucine patch superfamily enzyme|uniref:Uncharacterized protein n=1 Tax=Candidatus Nitrospira allomarina TaxID=3020900 RepID=A0AA96GFP9_9BACT|nr:hypothetical protein [Candidatus Nitrospira allomarina]WNM57993.1 hypothetical protein PP769_18785 [Candidatus Nitrospira allomarina]
MKKVKLWLAIIISVVPVEYMRRLLYKTLLGYSIDNNSRIGFMTIIAVDSADIRAANIGKFNKFVGPYRLRIGAGASMGRDNVISCGAWVAEKRFAKDGYGRFCHLGNGSVVTSSHFIDPTGGFNLGSQSWIAGSHSQFWTHGIGVKDRSISIGSDCYIGSASRFAPGSSIGSNNTIGLGSVVVGQHNEECALIAGVPAKVIHANYNWRERYTQSS